jgi:hypothetical protein
MKYCIAALVLVLIVGCGGTPLVEKHQSTLLELEPGVTTIEEFRAKMPEATLGGQNSVNGKRVDAFEIKQRRYEIEVDRFITERLWFYFHDDRLVRWGQPNDWPSEADITVEWRDR